MKNLDELLIELRQVYDELNELKESNKEKKIDDIDFNKIKNKAKSIPLKNQILKNSKEYIQKSYLNLLASILHFNNLEDIRQSQILYVARIIEGIGNKNITLESIYSSSMDISIGEVNEAITQVSRELADLFIVDMIVCANIKGKAKDDILEYISNVFSLMNVKFDVMKELIYLANSILLLDRDRILNTKSIVDLNRFNYNFISIINEKIYYKLDDIEKGAVGDLILINDKVQHIEEPINFDEFKFKSIKFINCVFNDVHSIVCLNKKVDFISCKFENIKESYTEGGGLFSSQTAVDFMCIKNINIIKCQFINCSTSSCLINLTKGNLIECEFTKCSSGKIKEYNYVKDNYIIKLKDIKVKDIKINLCFITRNSNHNTTYAGILYVENSKVDDIKMINCRTYPTTGYGSYARLYSNMIYGEKSNIINCSFENCTCDMEYHSYSRDYYYYQYVLNLNNCIQKNNKFIDCKCEYEVVEN